MAESATAEYVTPSAAPDQVFSSVENASIATVVRKNVRAWRSFADLMAALPERERERVYEGSDGDGYPVWFHDVHKGTGEQVLRDGVLYDRKVTVARRVVLSQQEALDLLPKGIHADHWNGFTWVMDGHKLGKHPHEEFMSGGSQDNSFLEEAPAADQALIAAAQSAKAQIINPLLHVQEVRSEPPIVIPDDTRPARTIGPPKRRADVGKTDIEVTDVETADVGKEN